MLLYLYYVLMYCLIIHEVSIQLICVFLCLMLLICWEMNQLILFMNFNVPDLLPQIITPQIDYEGFWQGPHPELTHVHFLIHIQTEGNTPLRGRGYWLNRNVYHSEFRVDEIILTKGGLEIEVVL